ncbi:hypothetical protein [Paraburkholderia sp. BL6669N2]|uniref:hypothetical protein n=1 Tax=Paraburkholderia sp. BL6669N2 TaxID=1938807 RepID=UPI0015F29490|nr:hypothetical protein [Paraburkholderia sp. BL6669N2]
MSRRIRFELPWNGKKMMDLFSDRLIDTFAMVPKSKTPPGGKHWPASGRLTAIVDE